MNMITHKFSLNQPRFANRGYVALLTVIFIGAIALAISIGLFYLNFSSLKIASDTENSYQARVAADSCMELALEKIREDQSYAGSENFDISNSNCQIDPVVLDSGTYTIQSHATIGTIIRKVKVTATRSDTDPNPITIQSWQEVADF